MKIDTTKIEGFEEMTAEEKVQAFLDYEYEDNSNLVKTYKDNIDRLSHEVAEKKKESKKLAEELKSRMSESELKAKEQEEYMKSLEEQNLAFKSEKRISNYTEKLVASGYDLETAKQMAGNLPEGIGDDFFAGQKSFLENKAKEFEQNALKNQPTISTSTKDIEEDDEMAKLMKYAGL